PPLPPPLLQAPPPPLALSLPLTPPLPPPLLQAPPPPLALSLPLTPPLPPPLLQAPPPPLALSLPHTLLRAARIRWGPHLDRPGTPSFSSQVMVHHSFSAARLGVGWGGL